MDLDRTRVRVAAAALPAAATAVLALGTSLPLLSFANSAESRLLSTSEEVLITWSLWGPVGDLPEELRHPETGWIQSPIVGGPAVGVLLLALAVTAVATLRARTGRALGRVRAAAWACAGLGAGTAMMVWLHLSALTEQFPDRGEPVQTPWGAEYGMAVTALGVALAAAGAVAASRMTADPEPDEHGLDDDTDTPPLGIPVQQAEVR